MQDVYNLCLRLKIKEIIIMETNLFSEKNIFRKKMNFKQNDILLWIKSV